MKKNTKIIIGIIIVLLILIPVIYTVYQNYQIEQEQKNFNKTLKEISNIENISDENYASIHNGNSTTATEQITKLNDTITNTTTEITMFQNLSKHTNNQSHKEYINNQIDRLNSENQYTKYELEYDQLMNKTMNGQYSPESNQKMQDLTDEMLKSTNKTNEIKENTTFILAENPELEKNINDLNLDEDFSTTQLEDYKANHISN